MGDSPYPLFFSAPVAPKEGAPAAPAAANVPGMPEGGGPLPPSITTVAGIQVVTADALRGLQGGDVTVAAPVPLGVPMPTSLVSPPPILLLPSCRRSRVLPGC